MKPETVSLKISASTLREGVWQGTLRSEGPTPVIEAVHEGRVLPGLTVSSAGQGLWSLRLPVPATLLSDGVQTVVLRDAGTGAVAGHFTVIAGVAMEDDIRAELDLLRAELDMLKRAFRRHCVETGAGGGG
ncbi:hypothetical protein L0V05_02690 [Tabrizicola sp. J26]|uniref:hypothetical protein n=1 Tax=Alitabrizicola rongguiensis TaxID=2909234 RepID=UPI001F2880E7|nr:hypothetical protein [Tabrizicola rongguiensis]MCF1707716.1 hypothetical protein [Tabrizicola rongguiensis]